MFNNSTEMSCTFFHLFLTKDLEKIDNATDVYLFFCALGWFSVQLLLERYIFLFLTTDVFFDSAV